MDSVWKGSRQLDSNRKNRLIPGPARRPNGHITIQQLDSARRPKSYRKSKSKSSISMDRGLDRTAIFEPDSSGESVNRISVDNKDRDRVRSQSASLYEAALELKNKIECDSDDQGGHCSRNANKSPNRKLSKTRAKYNTKSPEREREPERDQPQPQPRQRGRSRLPVLDRTYKQKIQNYPEAQYRRGSSNQRDTEGPGNHGDTPTAEAGIDQTLLEQQQILCESNHKPKPVNEQKSPEAQRKNDGKLQDSRKPKSKLNAKQENNQGESNRIDENKRDRHRNRDRDRGRDRGRDSSSRDRGRDRDRDSSSRDRGRYRDSSSRDRGRYRDSSSRDRGRDRDSSSRDRGRYRDRDSSSRDHGRYRDRDSSSRDRGRYRYRDSSSRDRSEPRRKRNADETDRRIQKYERRQNSFHADHVNEGTNGLTDQNTLSVVHTDQASQELALYFSKNSQTPDIIYMESIRKFIAKILRNDVFLLLICFLILGLFGVAFYKFFRFVTDFLGSPKLTNIYSPMSK